MAKDKEKLSSLDRAIMQAMGEGRVFGSVEDPAHEVFPELWQWLTRCYVGKDRVKQPAAIGISAVAGGFNVRISDRDLGVGIQVVVTKLQDAFSALEQALGDPNHPLANWGKKEPYLRKRKSES